MINKIKNKYYTYKPNEFLPIYTGGELLNKREFHIYKAKAAAATILRATGRAIDRATASH